MTLADYGVERIMWLYNAGLVSYEEAREALGLPDPANLPVPEENRAGLGDVDDFPREQGSAA